MVLVVDDDQAMIALLRTALELEGFQVETAADGVEAYRIVQSSDCRCMLLDMRMPRINGAELLLLMQADGIKVPTIVMAGSGDYAEGELKEFANVVSFLPKPFELEELIAEIKRITVR